MNYLHRQKSAESVWVSRWIKSHFLKIPPAACGWARDGQTLVLVPEITGARYPFPVITDICARYGEAAAQVWLITVTRRDTRTRCFNHNPPVTCHAVWQLVDRIDRAAASSPRRLYFMGGVFSNTVLPTQRWDRANPKVTFHLWYFLLFRLTSSLTYKKNPLQKIQHSPQPPHKSNTSFLFITLLTLSSPQAPPPPFFYYFFLFSWQSGT